MTSEVTPTPPPAPRPPVHKSPGLAVFFSLFPGLGHVYLGLYQRGIAFFTSFVAALWLADHTDLSGVVAAFIFFFGMFDAHRMAVTVVHTGEFPASGSTPVPMLRKGNVTLGIVLLAVGALLLYNNFYPLDLSFLADWWPASLILFGVWLVVKDLWAKHHVHPHGDEPLP
ncbi:MAG: LiaI-LiaF-like domain-containing protein [Thermoanaerobaculum sp.]